MLMNFLMFLFSFFDCPTKVVIRLPIYSGPIDLHRPSEDKPDITFSKLPFDSLKCLQVIIFHTARLSSCWSSISLDIFLYVVIICDTLQLPDVGYWCGAFALCLGIYAVLVKPVAHDLALIPCQLFPFPACKSPLSLPLFLRWRWGS